MFDIDLKPTAAKIEKLPAPAECIENKSWKLHETLSSDIHLKKKKHDHSAKYLPETLRRIKNLILCWAKTISRYLPFVGCLILWF